MPIWIEQDPKYGTSFTIRNYVRQRTEEKRVLGLPKRSSLVGFKSKMKLEDKIIDEFLKALVSTDEKSEERYIWKLYTDKLVSKLGYPRSKARKTLRYWWNIYTFKET